jgi:hypothetical protein
MPTALPLSELTALLARELAESAKTVERRQRDEYVALAAEFAGTLSEYRQRALRLSAEEQRVGADLLAEEFASSEAARTEPAFLVLDDVARQHLATSIGAPPDSFETASAAGAAQWVIRRETVEKLTAQTRQREVDARYRDARALLSVGLPKTQLRGGSLTVKVILSETPCGIVARLADEHAPTGADITSTLTVNFDLDAFPSITHG